MFSILVTFLLDNVLEMKPEIKLWSHLAINELNVLIRRNVSVFLYCSHTRQLGTIEVDWNILAKWRVLKELRHGLHVLKSST